MVGLLVSESGVPGMIKALGLKCRVLVMGWLGGVVGSGNAGAVIIVVFMHWYRIGGLCWIRRLDGRFRPGWDQQ